jgi:hypothetical protein
MSKDDGTKMIHMGTPEADAFVANIKRANEDHRRHQPVDV